jgi:hypothetical protein
MIESCQELLRYEAKYNRSIEDHKKNWENIRKLYNNFEIYQIIDGTSDNNKMESQHADQKDEAAKSQIASNILLSVIKQNTRKVAKFTWNQIKSILTQTKQITLADYLTQVNNHGKNIFHILMEVEDEEMLKFFSNELKNCLESEIYFIQILSSGHPEYPLQIAAKVTNLNFHRVLWDLMLSTFRNHEVLLQLILENKIYNNNFIHNLISHNNQLIICLTFQLLEKTLDKQQFNRILQSKSSHGRNLLQHAATCITVVEEFQTLLYFYSKDQFMESMNQKDSTSNNTLQIAAQFSSENVFNFLIKTLERFAS